MSCRHLATWLQLPLVLALFSALLGWFGERLGPVADACDCHDGCATQNFLLALLYLQTCIATDIAVLVLQAIGLVMSEHAGRCMQAAAVSR